MEMRIFSEDESLVSSPRIPKEVLYFSDCIHSDINVNILFQIPRRLLTRVRADDDCHNSANSSVDPSPKKQPRVIMSPESQSRKRTRLEDQLSDIRYIDCCTPDNVVSTTTAVIHDVPESPIINREEERAFDSYRPKNKSPRNSGMS